jgi:ABC-type Fe3+ transport system substrate-binding protein
LEQIHILKEGRFAAIPHAGGHMQKLKDDPPVADDEREELDFLGSIYCPCKERFADAYRRFQAQYNADKGDGERLRGVVPSEHRGDGKYFGIAKIKTREKFPAVAAASGYLDFFRTGFIENAENGYMRGWFSSLPLPEKTHPLFDGLELRDPKNIFSIYGAMPYILVVNHRRLNGRKVPRSIADLTAPEFCESVGVPYRDDDISEHLLLSVWKTYGAAGIAALARNVVKTGHAPELIADLIASKTADPGKDGRACVYLMTWFFANTAPKRDYIETVWPDDGALFCPLYAVAKTGLTETQKAAAAFLFGAELGQNMADGYFAHINPQVRCRLPPAAVCPHFQWIGWDYIYEKPLEDRVAEIERAFSHSRHDENRKRRLTQVCSASACKE